MALLKVSKQIQRIRDLAALVYVGVPLIVTFATVATQATDRPRIPVEFEMPPQLESAEASPVALPLVNMIHFEQPLPPPPEVDPKVCHLLRTKLYNVSLTGYTDPKAPQEQSASSLLPKYKQVFLDDAEVIKGKPTGLRQKDEDLLLLSSMQLLRSYMAARPNYPGVDIRIVKMTPGCEQLILSVTRDSTEVSYPEELTTALKDIRVSVTTPDPKNPEQLKFKAFSLEGAKALWTASVYMEMAMRVSLKDNSLASFQFGDILGMGAILPSAIMSKGNVLFTVRIERDRYPFGDVGWISSKFAEARERLSSEEKKAIAGLKFNFKSK